MQIITHMHIKGRLQWSLFLDSCQGRFWASWIICFFWGWADASFSCCTRMQGSLPQRWQTETRWELVLQQVPVQRLILLLPIAPAFASPAADATTFPLPPGSPPFPLRLVRREKGRCLEIPFEILPVRHRFIKAMTVRACTHLYQPCHHIKGKNEKEFQRGALIHPFPYFSVHTRMHARAHTHLPSLETNGLLLRPLVRSCAAGKTCTIPHCAQRWTTESATPISAISLENNEAATQGLWNGPIKGQDSLPRHGASWPKDKRVLSLIRVAADKSAFPMRSITATGSEPLSTPLSWLSVMKPPDTDKTSARTNVALVLFFFFEGWLSSVCSEVAQNWSDMTNSPHGSGRYWDR